MKSKVLFIFIVVFYSVFLLGCSLNIKKEKQINIPLDWKEFKKIISSDDVVKVQKGDQVKDIVKINKLYTPSDSNHYEDKCYWYLDWSKPTRGVLYRKRWSLLKLGDCRIQWTDKVIVKWYNDWKLMKQEVIKDFDPKEWTFKYVLEEWKNILTGENEYRFEFVDWSWKVLKIYTLNTEPIYWIRYLWFLLKDIIYNVWKYNNRIAFESRSKYNNSIFVDSNKLINYLTGLDNADEIIKHFLDKIWYNWLFDVLKNNWLRNFLIKITGFTGWRCKLIGNYCYRCYFREIKIPINFDIFFLRFKWDDKVLFLISSDFFSPFAKKFIYNLKAIENIRSYFSWWVFFVYDVNKWKIVKFPQLLNIYFKYTYYFKKENKIFIDQFNWKEYVFRLDWFVYEVEEENEDWVIYKNKINIDKKQIEVYNKKDNSKRIVFFDFLYIDDCDGCYGNWIVLYKDYLITFCDHPLCRQPAVYDLRNNRFLYKSPYKLF